MHDATATPGPGLAPSLSEGPPPQPSLGLSLVQAPSLCYAMEQAGVPLLRALRVQHLGGAPCANLVLKLRLGPDLGPERNFPLGPLAPGESLQRAVLDYRLPVGALRAVQEREQAEWLWSLEDEAWGTLLEGRQPTEVLPFHHWPGGKAPAELLACFVHPNHPVVTGLLAQAREALAASTGSPAFDGYQSGDPQRALAMARAAYGAIQGLGATYAEPPPSFESLGQKVRLPEELQQASLACCLDLALLAAACLEAMGLGALVVVVEGHAFPALWLVDEGFPEGLVEDAARLRTALALGQLVPFDSSAMVAQPPLDFGQARAIAERHLKEDGRFRHAIDLRRARLAGFRPMSLRPLGEAPLAEGSPLPEGEAPAPQVVVVREAAPATAEAPPTPRLARSEVPADVAARFDRWQERLLDLSLRNRLLAFRPGVGAAVPFEVPDLGLLEDLLAAGDGFALLPAAVVAADPRDAELAAARHPEAERKALLTQALAGRQLHASLGQAALPKQLKALERAARSSLEEGGAHTLYLALGLLKWYEGPAATSPRLAPLLLVPVALELDRVRLQWRLKRVTEDAVPNVTLVEKLRRDFGLDASALATPPSDDSGVDLAAVLRAAREAVSRMPRWEVLEEVHLGLFSFTKFLMWKDLQDQRESLLANPVVRHLASRTPGPFPQPAAEVAPEALDGLAPLPCVVDADSTQQAAVASALAGRSFVLQGPPGTGKSQTITTLIAAALAEGKRVLFVSEKLAALDVVHRRLEAVGLGDFCLELHSHQADKKAVVASLMRAYERSLVGEAEGHAEAMAELTSRRDQLNAVHGAMHRRRPLGLSLAQALDRLLVLREAPEARLPIQGFGPESEAAQLRQMREAIEALAQRGARVAPVQAQPWLGTRPPAWTAQGQEALADQLAEAERAVAAGQGAAEALLGALGPGGPAPEVMGGAAALDAAAFLAEALAGGALPAPTLGPDRAQAGARARAFLHAEGVAEREALALLQRWKPAFLDANRPAELALAKRRAEAGFLGGLFLDTLGGWPGPLKALAEGPLPAPAQVVADLEALTRLRTERLRLDEERRWVALELGLAPQALLEALARAELAAATCARLAALGAWGAGAEGPPHEAAARLALAGGSPEGAARLGAAARKAREALVALQGVEAALRHSLGLEADEAWPAPERPTHLAGLAERARHWAAALPSYRPWAGYAEAGRQAEALGLAAWAEAHRRGDLAAEALPAAFERRALALWASGVRDGEPSLAGFEAEAHEALAARFRALDAEATLLARRQVAAKLEARLPRREGLAPEGSEAGVLLREARKKARHLPVRRLLAAMPNLLARLKPCALMSPLSIAQYLPPTGPRFDLVVFDEASQIGTHDAIGAIARGDQVVIVGDSKQLPPTSFFQRGADEDEPQDENDVEELESVLEEALAQQLPQQSLAWHYRSRHEALIDFSNRHYYEDKLQIFPAAQRHDPALGLHWHPVPHAPYEAGSTRTNPKEAQALVAHLVAAMEANPPGGLSFGVVTFGMTQQALVLDLLEEARSARPGIEGHFQGPDRVFVKNLENVQGDERDVIYFSIGYAPDEAGRLRMHFGPLSQSGGERRLNVAITRARRRLHVFSALRPEDIDLARTTATGAEHLKAFLLHAAQSGGEEALRSDRVRETASQLGRDLKAWLEGQGHEVHAEVGCGAFRVGLGVVRPEGPGYLLGVELEAQGVATARDRERLRPQVLEGLGWRLHRVQPLEAWGDLEGERQRLKAALEAALQAPSLPSPPPPALPAAEAWTAAHPAEGQAEQQAPSEPEASAPEAPPDPDGPRPYRQASLPSLGDGEALYEPMLAKSRQQALAQVVAEEGPLAQDLAARRLVEAFGLKRLTDKAKRQAQADLGTLVALGQLRQAGDFVWAASAEAWRGFRVPAKGQSPREAHQIPPEEWAAAMAWVLAQAVAIEREALCKEAHKALGLGAWNAKSEGPSEAALASLLAQGQAQAQGSQIRLQG